MSRGSAVIGLVIGALALRLFRLGHQSLWSDEVISYLGARASFWAILTRPADPHFELYQLTLHAVSLFGGQEWLLRLPSVVFGVLSVALLWSIVNAWLGREAGVLAAALLAISPFHLWYSQEARSYALLLFLALLSFWFLQKALGGRYGLWPNVGFVLATAGLFYCHPVGAAFIGFVVIYALWQTPRRGWAGWLSIFGAIAVLLVPALYHVLTSPPNASVPSYRSFSPIHFPYVLWTFLTGYSLGPSVAELQMPDRAGTLMRHLPLIAPLMIFLGAVLLRGFVRLRREPGAVFWANVMWFAIPLAFAVSASVLTGHPFNARYVILSFPPFLVFIAVGALSLPRGWLRAGAVGALLLVSLVSLRNYYYDERYHREDNRSSGQFLAAHAAPGDLVIACPPYTLEGLRHYAGRDDLRMVGFSASPAERAAALNRDQAQAGRDTGPVAPLTALASSLPLATPSSSADPQVADDLRRIIGDRPHAWLFLSRAYHGDPEGQLRRFFADHLRADLRFQGNGVEVIRYVQR